MEATELRSFDECESVLVVGDGVTTSGIDASRMILGLTPFGILLFSDAIAGSESTDDASTMIVSDLALARLASRVVSDPCGMIFPLTTDTFTIEPGVEIVMNRG
jgi:hypothetical protein